jgi:hypothetical protein
MICISKEDVNVIKTPHIEDRVGAIKSILVDDYLENFSYIINFIENYEKVSDILNFSFVYKREYLLDRIYGDIVRMCMDKTITSISSGRVTTSCSEDNGDLLIELSLDITNV